MQGDDLRAFYTDGGVLPRAALLQQFGWPHLWSLHLFNGSLGYAYVMFGVAFICALAMLVGYRTQWATAASWLLLISLHSRNPLLLHGGDTLLRLALFWAIFLPLGTYWSWDSMHSFAKTPIPARPIPSVAFAIQMVCVYGFAFLWKTGPEWHDGTALQYALSIEQISTPFGQWLRTFPELLHSLTRITLWLEIVIPILIFFPVWNRYTRTAAVLLMLTLQLGFGFALRVGHFPWVAGAAALALLPGWFWERREIAVDDPKEKLRQLSDIIVVALLIVVVAWNAATVRWIPFPQGLTAIPVALRLDQQWDMFAPSPREPDGWYVIRGEIWDQSPVAAWRDSIFSDLPWQKPSSHDMNAQYPSERWAVYMLDLHKPENHAELPFFARYICQRWNEKEPKKLHSLEVFWMERTDLLATSPNQPISKHQLITTRCD